MSNEKITHSMSHFFNVQIATDYNPNVAIFMTNIAHWTLQNIANERHIHDGRCWTYNTLKAFQTIFPYFSKKNLETVINKSIDAGLLVKGNYNKAKYDRTTWYAMTEKAIEYLPEVKNASERLLLLISQKREMELSETGNGIPRTETPIPDINTNNKNNNILLAPSSQKKKKSPPKESFGLKEMLSNNPHQIPEEIISDWLDVRKAKKAKITKTAWNKTNKELSKAVSKGFDAIDSFEHAVASGWQGFKCEYMENLSRTSAKTSTINDIFGDDDDISWGSHFIKNELKGLAG